MFIISKIINTNIVWKYYLLGVSSTGMVLAFVVGGHVIPLYSIFLLLVFYDLIVGRQRPMKCGQLERSFKAWMGISILSSLFGIVYFIGKLEWQQMSLSYIPKVLIYLLLFFLLKRNVERERKISSILKGLLFGIILNVVWSIADVSLFYTSGESLTNNVFQAYIQAKDMRYGQLSLILGPVIRSGGLNGDPANLGMFATVLAAYALYSKKYILYFLSILSGLAGVSFVAIGGILLVSLFYFGVDGKISKLIPVLCLGVLIAVVLLSTNNDIINGLEESFSGRMEMKSETAGDSDNNRRQYFVNFLPAVVSSPTYFVIGTGYMTASYAYLSNGLTTHKYEPYDPECTYFSNYFDFGLIGFAMYIYMFWLLLTISRANVKCNPSKQNIFIYTSLMGILVSFWGYHYTLYSVVMLITICGIIYYGNQSQIITRGKE